jgi:hypothetical protein
MENINDDIAALCTPLIRDLTTQLDQIERQHGTDIAVEIRQRLIIMLAKQIDALTVASDDDWDRTANAGTAWHDGTR